MATEIPQKQLRDFTLSVRLRPEMKERLELVAEQLGVASATVASMAIGQYVAAQYTALTAAEKQGQTMGKAVTDALMEIFNNQVSESEPPCSSSKESSVQLPLLAAEPTAKPAKSSLSAKSFKSKPSTVAASSKSKPSPSLTPSPTPRKSAKK
jgi:predicted transcriptional regulator